MSLLKAYKDKDRYTPFVMEAVLPYNDDTMAAP